MMLFEYDFDYYAVNQDNKLVYGFTDFVEAKFYCEDHQYKLMTKDQIKQQNIVNSNIDDWSDTYYPPI